MKTLTLLALFFASIFAGSRLPAPAAREAVAAAPLPAESATATSTGWDVETVDSAGMVGYDTSIAFHPDTGIPYVSYVLSNSTQIGYAFLRSGSITGNCSGSNQWHCVKGETAAFVGYTALAFAPDGTRGIAYYLSSGTPQNRALFSYPNGSGSIVTVESVLSGIVVGQYNSLKLDSKGAGHLAYQRILPMAAAELRYARYVSAGGNCGGLAWQCDTIESGAFADFESLDLNFVDHPLVAYHGGNDELKLATYLGSGGNCGQGSQLNQWQCDVIDTSAADGYSASLYARKCLFCPTSNQIAYEDKTNGTLKYARPVGSGGNCGPGNSWQCDVIAPMGAFNMSGPRRLALAVDGAGQPIIAYHYTNSPANHALKIARRVGAGGNCGPSGTTWQCDVVDSGLRYVLGNPVAKNVGVDVSIAVNSAGLAAIAYRNESDGDLLVARELRQTFLPLVVR